MDFVQSLYYNFDSSETVVNKLIKFIKETKMMEFNYKMTNSDFNYEKSEAQLRHIFDFVQDSNNKMDVNLFMKYFQSFDFNPNHCYNIYDLFYEYLHIILGLMNQTYNSPIQNVSNYMILVNKIIIIYEYILNNIFNKNNTTICQNFESTNFLNIYQSLSDFDFTNINGNIDMNNEDNNQKILSIKTTLDNVLFNLYNNHYSNINYLLSNYSEYNMNSSLSHSAVQSLKDNNMDIINDTVNEIQCAIAQIKEILYV